MEGTGPPVRETVEFTRIVAFTDGVFAIAITLLVLSLEVPASIKGPDLHEFLVESWPQFFAYFLSFAVIGRFWISHHEVFSLLHDFDRRLLVLNLVYLSLVVLIPFPTELLGDYGDRTDPVVLYAAVVGSAALLTARIIRDGGEARVRPPGAPRRRRSHGRRACCSRRSCSTSRSRSRSSARSPGQLFWLALLLQRFVPRTSRSWRDR